MSRDWPIFRTSVWALVTLAVLASLSARDFLEGDELIDEGIFSVDWILVDQLNTEILDLAKFARIQRKPGYLDAYRYEFFVPEKTRVLLSLQNIKGLKSDTKPGEFAYMVFGKWYKTGITNFADARKLPRNKVQEMLIEAEAFAKQELHQIAPASSSLSASALGAPR